MRYCLITFVRDELKMPYPQIDKTLDDKVKLEFAPELRGPNKASVRTSLALADWLKRRRASRKRKPLTLTLSR